MLAFGLRAYHRGVQPYWWDELLTVWVSEAPIPILLRTLNAATSNATDLNPPLFYLLTHLWMNVSSPKEGDVRLLSAVIGALTVPVIVLLGETLFSLTVGLAAGVLFALSPLAIYYGFQTRNYSLLTFLAAASALTWYRLWKQPDRRRAVAVLVVNTAVLFTHYAGIWFTGSMVLATGLQLARGIRSVVLPRTDRLFSFLRLCTGFIGLFVLGILAFRMFPSLYHRGIVWGISPWTVTLFLPLAILLATVLPPLTVQNTPKFRPLLLAVIAIGIGFLVSFAPWFISTGVWKTVADQGKEKLTSELFFTHLSQLAGLYDSQNVRAGPSMFSIWIFLVAAGAVLAALRNPDAAILLVWWICIPVAAIIFTGNKHIISQISRYIYYSLPAYILLLTFTVSETFRIITDCISRMIPKHKYKSPLTSGIQIVFTLGFLVFIFGPQHLPVIAHPDNRNEYEDMIGITQKLTELGPFCLASDNQNMLRWTIWYTRVYHQNSGLPYRCNPDSPILLMIPGDGKGMGIPQITWQPVWKQEGIPTRTPFFVTRGVILYREPRPVTGISTDTTGLLTLPLNEIAGWKIQQESTNVAWIQFPAGVKPADKTQPGVLMYSVKPGFPFAATGAAITAQTDVHGTGSSVTIALRNGDTELGRAEFSGVGTETKAVQWQTPITRNTNLTLVLTLVDDNSGALYSSDVRAERISIRFTR